MPHNLQRTTSLLCGTCNRHEADWPDNRLPMWEAEGLNDLGGGVEMGLDEGTRTAESQK